MTQDQTRTIRMPKLASIPTLRELRRMVASLRREGRPIEQSWRLSAKPDSFQLRVQSIDGVGEPKWTIRQVEGVEAREVWSAHTAKLILVRAAAARASGLKYEDLPLEDDDEDVEEEFLEETSEIGAQLGEVEVDSHDGSAAVNAAAENERIGAAAGSKQAEPNPADGCDFSQAQERIDSVSAAANAVPEQSFADSPRQSSAEGAASQPDAPAAGVGDVAVNTTVLPTSIGSVAMQDCGTDELWSGSVFPDKSASESDPDMWNQEIYTLGPDAGDATLLSMKLVEPATGLHTYPAMLKMLEHEFHRFESMRSPLSLMLLNIVANNQPLDSQALFAASLRLELVKRDLHVAGHFEKGALALAMPCTGPIEATVIGQRVLELLNSVPLTPVLDHADTKVSIGIASLPDDGKSLAELVSAASAAKEKACRDKSGRICTAQECK